MNNIRPDSGDINSGDIPLFIMPGYMADSITAAGRDLSEVFANTNYMAKPKEIDFLSSLDIEELAIINEVFYRKLANVSKVDRYTSFYAMEAYLNRYISIEETNKALPRIAKRLNASTDTVNEDFTSLIDFHVMEEGIFAILKQGTGQLVTFNNIGFLRHIVDNFVSLGYSYHKEKINNHPVLLALISLSMTE